MFRKPVAALCAFVALVALTHPHVLATVGVGGPSPWPFTDIGSVGVSGNTSAYDGNFFVSGAGSDIWGTSDSFQFAYLPVTADAQIITAIGQIQNTSPYAKAGVMIRQTLTPDSPHVILDMRPDGSLEFMRRYLTANATEFLAGGSAALSTDLLRLTRNGTAITASMRHACCGSEWTTIGSTELGWIGAAYVGLAVTSHDPSTLNNAVFDAPQVTQLLPPWQETFLYTPQGSQNAWSQNDFRFNVPGSGSDIWGTADSFHFVWQPLTGDGQVVARVTSEQPTSPYAKAGVMMRSNLGSSDADAILDVRPDGSLELMARPTPGAETSFIAGGSATFPVWLKLVRAGDQVTGYQSSDGNTWTVVGVANVTLSPNGTTPYAGLAVTSHDPTQVNSAFFDNVSVTLAGSTPQNLLQESGFEGYTPPALGLPGWVSDPIRQVPAKSETNQPHSGTKNGACWTTDYLDCGMYQDVSVPVTGTYSVTMFANADRPGAFVGVNINGSTTASTPVDVRGFDNYGAAYTMTFTAHGNDVVRVWMYSPATPGYLVIDDVSLTKQ